MKQAFLYKKLKEKDLVRCLACSHKCFIRKEDVGICGVRKNINNKLYLLVSEKIISMNPDPIEKKPFYKFLPGTRSFSIGTIGCNMSCSFCQNFDISQMSKEPESRIIGKEITSKEIVDKAIETGCESIAYTYNEPIIWIEFVKDIAKISKEKGLKNVLVSNGFWSKKSFDYISDYIDAINFDLKSMNRDFYKKICKAKLNPVLNTIKRAVEKGIHVEITTLLIPNENDSEKELEKIAKFIASLDKNIVWHISRFFPRYKMKDKPVTHLSDMEKAYKIGKKYLKNVYLGNI